MSNNFFACMHDRINYIDRMKGFTMLLVVMGHVYLFSMQDTECIVDNIIVSFHMPLFMFLSGLVAASGITKPYWTAKKIGKKIFALLMPMLVFGIIFTMTLGGVESFDLFVDKAIGFINSPNKNGYWYLMSLSVYYLTLQLFRLNRWNHWIDILIACVTFVSIFLGWKFTAQVNDPFCLLDCGNNYFSFILGAFITKYRLMDKLVKHNSLIIVCLIAYILLFGYVCPIHALNSLLKHIVVPLCAIIVIVTLFVKREHESSRIERSLDFIGKNTLDVYVLHYFFVTNINLIALDRWLQNTNNPVLSIFLVLIVSLLITYLTIAIGKLLHSINLIDKFVYGRL